MRLMSSQTIRLLCLMADIFLKSLQRKHSWWKLGAYKLTNVFGFSVDLTMKNSKSALGIQQRNTEKMREYLSAIKTPLFGGCTGHEDMWKVPVVAFRGVELEMGLLDKEDIGLKFTGICHMDDCLAG